MIRTARYKLFAFSYGQRPEMLFELSDDPGETRDLAYQAAYRDFLSKHRGQLKKEIARTADPFILAG